MTSSSGGALLSADQSSNIATELTGRERFLKALRCEEVDRPPFWIMRQAGRYLPSYMALRVKHSFDEMTDIPELAAEVALLPREVLQPDALIIFNDILVPLRAMGRRVVFAPGGPVIENPVRAEADLADFTAFDYTEAANTPIVVESLRALKREAGADQNGEQQAVIGFAGAPLTMAAYTIEGKMTRNLENLKRLLFAEPDLAHRFLERISDTVASYLIAQARDGGADVLQLFDTWAGELDPWAYREFAHRWQAYVIEKVRAALPETPLILFQRGGEPCHRQMRETGASALSVDWRVPLSRVRELAGDNLPLQGNMDPLALYAPPEAVQAAFARSIEGFDTKRGYIANLGHGILPRTPVESAQAFADTVRNL